MSNEDDSASSSVPSAADTSVDSSSENPPHMVEVHGGRCNSSPEQNEEMALKLKDQGNEQLLKGHLLQAIGWYSEALEYAPTNVVILSNRAQAYIKVENYGLAMADATAALESDPKYAKAYYRRGSAQYALTHYKEARKDFRKVCSLKPKDKDARAKFQACEKAVREEAFSKAIMSEKTAPLSETYDPGVIKVAEDYDGPNPIAEVPTNENMDLEASLFEPGNLPREFVLVSIGKVMSRSYECVFAQSLTRNCSTSIHLLGRHGTF
jgi:serine/threonine-protein phosphatase 5